MPFTVVGCTIAERMASCSVHPLEIEPLVHDVRGEIAQEQDLGAAGAGAAQRKASSIVDQRPG